MKTLNYVTVSLHLWTIKVHQTINYWRLVDNQSIPAKILHPIKDTKITCSISERLLNTYKNPLSDLLLVIDLHYISVLLSWHIDELKKKKHETRYLLFFTTSTYSIMYMITPTNDKTGCHMHVCLTIVETMIKIPIAFQIISCKWAVTLCMFAVIDVGLWAILLNKYSWISWCQTRFTRKFG